MTTQTIINAATAATTGQAFSFDDSTIGTFQAIGSTSSGAGAAVINIYVSNNPSTFNSTPVGVITLTLGTSNTSDSVEIEGNWSFVRASVASISGTDATVTVYMGT